MEGSATTKLVGASSRSSSAKASTYHWSAASKRAGHRSRHPGRPRWSERSRLRSTTIRARSRCARLPVESIRNRRRAPGRRAWLKAPRACSTPPCCEHSACSTATSVLSMRCATCAAAATTPSSRAQGWRWRGGAGGTGAGLRRAQALVRGVVGVTLGAEGLPRLEQGREQRAVAPHVVAIDTLAAGARISWRVCAGDSEGPHGQRGRPLRQCRGCLKCTRAGGRLGAPTRAEVDTFLAASEQ